MKQQRIERRSGKTGPTIDDRRPVAAAALPDNIEIIKAPVRTVLYVEVGDAPPQNVKLLVAEINKVYQNASGGEHYVVPVRNGKLGNDVVFEDEFLAVVEAMCEVKGNKIQLRDGTREVLIVRERVT